MGTAFFFYSWVAFPSVLWGDRWFVAHGTTLLQTFFRYLLGGFVVGVLFWILKPRVRTRLQIVVLFTVIAILGCGSVMFFYAGSPVHWGWMAWSAIILAATIVGYVVGGYAWEEDLPIPVAGMP